jgi:hypothetical protein
MATNARLGAAEAGREFADAVACHERFIEGGAVGS